MSEDDKRIVRRYFTELDRQRAAPVTSALGFHLPRCRPSSNGLATRQFAAMFFDALAT
jgi:hypothetical protein